MLPPTWPPAKRQRPNVPVFTGEAFNGITAGEEERRRKAGLMPDVLSSSLATDPSTSSAPTNGEDAAAAAASAAADSSGSAEGGGSSSSSKPTEVLDSPEALAQALADFGTQAKIAASKPGGVYGLDGGKLKETKSRAISLRLEPLVPGLPEFERVLNEQRQAVVIGCIKNLADVVIRDEAISKKHVSLALVGIHRELALSVIDHSTNGAWINGERLPARGKRFRVRNGDRLEIKDPSMYENFGWKCDFGNTVSYFSR